MTSRIATDLFLAVAAIPFFYYLIALYSSWKFFGGAARQTARQVTFTPPVSVLKPVRGLDPEAYENFASFCRQDYPEYEIVFCVGERDDPALGVIEALKRDFPERPIRVIFSAGYSAANDKVAKLVLLVNDARFETLVIADSDVRVRPDYLRSVVAPLVDSRVGAATCLYVSTNETTLTQKLQSVGMISDFYAGVLTARELDGVKFAFGQTIVTTRARLAGFGGYQVIENRPADDLLVGRLIAEQGYRVELLPYVVQTVADFHSMRDLLHKRIRWMTVMRHMRPWGHVGLIFTHGLPWALAAVAVRPSAAVALGYLGTYCVLRIAITWMIGIHGLKQTGLWKKVPLIAVWDGTAFVIWLLTFGRKSIRWRDVDYRIQQGILVPTTPHAAQR